MLSLSLPLSRTKSQESLRERREGKSISQTGRARREIAKRVTVVNLDKSALRKEKESACVCEESEFFLVGETGQSERREGIRGKRGKWKKTTDKGYVQRRKRTRARRRETE